MRTKWHKAIAVILTIATILPYGTLLGLAAEPDPANPGEVVGYGDFDLAAYNRPADGMTEHTTGNIHLVWDELGTDWAYRYYQRQPGETRWEERSTKYGKEINVLNLYPRGGTYLENWLKAERFQSVITEAGAKINVTSVTQSAFANADDPETTYLKDAEGKYKYDVVVLGFYDLNGDNDINRVVSKGVPALKNWLEAGRGLLFGHDTFYDNAPNDGNGSTTLSTGNNDRFIYKTTEGAPTHNAAYNQWFNDHGGNTDVWIPATWAYAKLAEYVEVIPGVSADGTYWTSRYGSAGYKNANNNYVTGWQSENIEFHGGGTGNGGSADMLVSYIEVTDGGFLTTYPNKLPVGTVLTVPYSHVNGSASAAKEWMTYVADKNGAEFQVTDQYGRHYEHHEYEYNNKTYKDSGYLVTKENAALIQTGHYSGRVTKDEIAVIVNTLYHLAQLTGDNALDDSSALDLEAPDKTTAKLISYSGTAVTVNIHAEDRGTEYEMYIEALDQSGKGQAGQKSNVVRQTSKTGTKGYLYMVSGKDAAEITMADIADVDTGGNFIPQPVEGAKVLGHIMEQGAELELDYINNAGNYVHMVAYDYAGNLSEIATYKVDDFRPGIHVKVIDSQGRAIPSAKLMALGLDDISVDENGEAMLYPTTLGTYTVAAIAGGYNMGSKTITITAEEYTAEAVIELKNLDSGSLYGYVYDKQTGDALAGAIVKTLTGRETASDDLGFYVIDGLAEGDYTVIAGKDSYNTGFSLVAVPKGRVQKDFYLTEQTGDNNEYIVTGFVRDAGTKAGLNGAAVTHQGEVETVAADSFGGYAIGYFKGAQKFDYSYKGYAPKTGEIVDFTTGDQVHDVELENLEGKGRVVLRVKNEEGNLLNGVGVFFGGQEKTTSNNGEAVFDTPYGTYALLARIVGYNAYTSSITVDKDYTLIEITLVKGAQGGLYGQVIDNQTQLGIPGAAVATANPSGGSTVADSGGFYVLAPLTPGTHGVIASHPQYCPNAENMLVSNSIANRYDIYLEPTDTDLFYVFGQVTDEANGQAVAGATVKDKTDENKVSYSDTGGFYALLSYEAGAAAQIYASHGNQISDTKNILVQNGPVQQNLLLRSRFTVVVQYLVEGTNNVLFSYELPSSKGAEPFKVYANPYPGYRLVTEPDWAEVNPAVAQPDENGQYFVKFYYKNNLVDVVIEAVTIDGGNISTFTPFTVSAEVGSRFSYENIIDIQGYTFNHRDDAIMVSDSGRNVFKLYYYQDTGNMAVKAIDVDTGAIIGTVDHPLQKDDKYEVTWENSPDKEKIAELQYYTLDLENSYVGKEDTKDYTYTGDGSSIPDAVYVFKRNTTPVTVELRNVDNGAVIASDIVQAYQGKTYDYSYAQAQALLQAKVNNSGDYVFLTKEDQKIYITAGSEKETLVFYLKSSLEDVTLEIFYQYITDNGEEQMITSSSLTGKEGEQKTIEAAEIAGWILAEEEDREKEIILQKGMKPVVFFYNQDLVTISVSAASGNGNTVILPPEAGTLKVARNTAYTLLAPAVEGYRAVGYQRDGVLYEGTVISFSAKDMAEDQNVVFIYDLETMADYTVSVKVTGRTDEDTLYSYTAVFPKGSGEQVINAFTFAGYKVVGSQSVNVQVEDTATPMEVEFFYTSLDTHVTIQFVNKESNETRVITEKATQEEAFSYRAPYVEGWYLLDKDTVQTIEKVEGGEVLVFNYGKIAEASVLVVAKEVDTEGNFVQDIKVAVQDTGKWTNGNRETIEVKTLLNLEDAPNYYLYAKSPSDPEATGVIKVTYDEINGHQFIVHYTKEMVDVPIEAVDTEGNVIQRITTSQRKGEVFSAEAPEVDLALYAPTGVTAKNAVALEDTPVQFVFRRLGSGEVVVVATDADNQQNLLLSYVVTGNIGQKLTIPAPDLTGRSWSLAPGQGSFQTVTIAGQNEPVKFLYKDERFVLNLYIKQDDSSEPWLYLPQRHAAGDKVTVFAPYVDGYVLRAYKIGNNAEVQVDEDFFGLSLAMEQDTGVVFYYQPISEIVDEYTVLITVDGIEKQSSRALYTYQKMVPINSGIQKVEAFIQDGYRLISENPAAVEVKDKDIKITFEYESLATAVTVKMADDKGEIAAAYRVNAETGKAMTVYAPNVPRYYLTGKGEQSIIPVADGDQNIVTFTYEKINSKVTLTAKEELDAGSRLIRVFEIDTAKLEAGKEANVDVPEIEGYTPVNDSIVLTWDGTNSLNVDAYYTKNMVDVTIHYVDYLTGEKVADSAVQNVRTGEAATFTAIPVENYQLAGELTATIIAAAGENTVTFRYRTLAEAEVSVKLVSNTDGRLIDTYVVTGTTGEKMTLKAPLKQGWSIKGATEKTVTVGTEKEVVFFYEPNTVKVTMVLETEKGESLGKEEVELLRGSRYTARAPHLAGYVIVGNSDEFFANVDKDEEVTFTYRHISIEVPQYTVDIQVRGMDSDTNSEIYSYTIQRPKNSGAMVVTAMDTAGYDLEGSNIKTVIVEEENIVVTFEYTSIKRVVTVYAITADGQNVPDFAPILAEANQGQSFTYNAPHIVGYNYVGFDTESGLDTGIIQSIDSVQENAVMFFQYEKANGNVLVTLREGGPNGRIIKTLSNNIAQGESKEIPIPNLRGSYYTAISTETEIVENIDNSMLYVEYYYKKDTRPVVIYALDADSRAVLALKDAGEYRVGETAAFQAFYSRQLDGYRLTGSSEAMVLIEPGNGTAVVEFLYQPIDEGEVLVLAADKATDNILGTTVLQAEKGSTLRVNALAVTGYNLASGEASNKTVTAPGTALFYYNRDEVTVTVKLLDSQESLIPVSDDVQLEFIYGRGQNVKVFAPHMPGYIIQDTGNSIVRFTPITTDEEVTFVYQAIEEVIGGYQVAISITGAQGDEIVLYEDKKDAIRNSGQYIVQARDLIGYELSKILVDGVVQEEANIEAGHAMVDIAEKNIDVVFQYRNLGTNVIVLLKHAESKEVIKTLYVAAQEGQPFTYHAPYLENYYLASDSTIGSIDQVQPNGASVLDFYYLPLGNTDIVLIAKEKGGSSDGRIISLHPVDTDGWSQGLHNIYVPNLQNDYFTYAGNEINPEDETQGYFEYQYQPGQGTQYIEVYYTKDMAQVKAVAREKTPTGKILTTQNISCRKGEAAAIAAPAVKDYNLISETPTVLIPVDNMDIVFLYEPSAPGSGGGNGNGGGGGGGSEEKTAVLTVKGRDERGKELYTDTASKVIGSVVTVKARVLQGYVLDDFASKSITIVADSSKNVVVFQYIPEEEDQDKEEEQDEDQDQDSTEEEDEDKDHNLILDTHISYLSGYGDGAFRPKNNITRGEVAAVFYQLMADHNKALPQQNPYTDIAGNEWYAQAVLYLTGKGILSGYGDGTFRPQENITRAEMATICSQFFVMDGTAQHPFTDIANNHWAAQFISNAYNKGWISGYGDGTFKPDAKILRGEAVVMVNGMLERKIHPEDIPAEAKGYIDVSKDYWAYAAILEASNSHGFNRGEDGYEIWIIDSVPQQ